MHKLKLMLDDLRVESFDTTAAMKEKGTVFGEQCTCYTQCTCPGCPTCDNTCPQTCAYTCDDATCAYTCDDASCAGTCGASCGITCGESCGASCWCSNFGGYSCPVTECHAN